MKNIIRLGLFVFSCLFAQSIFAIQINAIDVFGNQRVSKGSLLAKFDIKVGQDVSKFAMANALKRLYQSGLYSDIKLFIDGNRLIVEVVEQPAIVKVEVEGNSIIPQASLEGAMKEMGLFEGELLNPSIVESIKQELIRQYGGQGYYSATVGYHTVAKPNNQVDLIIDVVEGELATVKSIDIIGNRQLTDDVVEDQLLIKASGEDGLFQWITGSDDFNYEKFTASKKLLENYYKDKGFIRYKLNSNQILIDENQHDMSLIMNVSEGNRYRVKSVKLAGDIELYKKQLMDLIQIKNGDFYSATTEQRLRSSIINYLSSKGYAFAKVEVQHDIDDELNKVGLEYQIWPGERVYTRQIIIKGNNTTKDEVLRREMVLMEGEVVTNTKINRSRSKLQRLGYFNSVTITTQKIEGENRLLDVVVTVEEGSNGTITGTLGWSGTTGGYVEASYKQNNFLGMGTAITATVNVNSTQQNFSLSYDDPYIFANGVGLNGSVFYQKSDFSDTVISSYKTDKYGVKLGLSYPLTANSRIGYGLSYEHTDLHTADNPVLEISDFELNYGDQFDTVEAWNSWTYSTLNNRLFNATSGNYIGLYSSVTVPPGDLKFYRFTANIQKFFEIYKGYSIRFHSELGYGNAYGDEIYPFYKNFYGGGPSSVRGFNQSSLGPAGTQKVTNDNGTPDDKSDDYDTYSAGSSIGGNIRTEAGVELIFPIPFLENKNAWRTSLFVDAGNIYTTHCHENNSTCETLDPKQVRIAAGLDINWQSPIGIPLNFTFAYPLHSPDSSEEDSFNFTLGTTTF